MDKDWMCGERVMRVLDVACGLLAFVFLIAGIIAAFSM